MAAESANSDLIEVEVDAYLVGVVVEVAAAEVEEEEARTTLHHRAVEAAILGTVAVQRERNREEMSLELAELIVRRGPWVGLELVCKRRSRVMSAVSHGKVDEIITSSCDGARPMNQILI